jgi:hypothetical protein
MSLEGHVCGSYLHKLSGSYVEVGAYGICSMLLGLRNGEIEVCFDLVLIGLHLHKDVISFAFVSLDLATEAVDFICSMA